MDVLSTFEQIYVINLPHRTDRRGEMGAQLARLGLGFDSPHVTLFSAVRPSDSDGFESIGARGCYMSHLQILRQSIGMRSVLILEDDLNFVSDVEARLGPAVDALPSGWGVFYGGCVVDAPRGSGLLTEVDASTPIRTTHFVGFNGAVIEPLIAYLEAILTRPRGHVDGGPMHVDGAYSRFRAANPEVRTLVAIPELGYQRPSRTDIHALKWFDRLPLVKEAVQEIRRVRALRRRSGQDAA